MAHASQVEVACRNLAAVRAAVARVRAFKFDTAIDYQGLWKSAALPFLARIPRRIGFSSHSVREFGVPILYTERVRVTLRHVVDQNSELSVRAGAQRGIAPVRLIVEAAAQERIRALLRQQGLQEYIVLSPGGGWRSKCWPAERFGQLAQRIHSAMGLRCAINFAQGEEDLVSAVRAAAGGAHPVPVAGSLPDLMALLCGARCVVAGDTGPLHLADSLGTPVVALFGPTDPERNGPYFKTGAILRAANVDTTYKRHDASHPSLLELSVDEVFRAIQRTRGGA
jgi:heptosyltransferase-1